MIETIEKEDISIPCTAIDLDGPDLRLAFVKASVLILALNRIIPSWRDGRR